MTLPVSPGPLSYDYFPAPFFRLLHPCFLYFPHRLTPWFPLLLAGCVYPRSDRSYGHVWSRQQIPGALVRGQCTSLEIVIKECIISQREATSARFVYISP